MIFTGDFLYPFTSKDSKLFELDPEFLNTDKVINFESSLEGVGANISYSPIPLLSSKHSMQTLEALQCKVACLANNHVKDFSPNFDKLKDIFDSHFIKTVGAGNNLVEAQKAVVYNDYVILNFGWDVIGCIKATETSSGTNPFEYSHIKSSFNYYKNNHPFKKLIVIFHWGYEFEIYPHPAHREIAIELARSGAYAIIGHHSHIIMGHEEVNGTPIFYGLGNFYMPIHKTPRGNLLKYKKEAYLGLCVDLKDIKDIKFYLARMEEDNYLKVTREEKLSIPFMEERSKFIGMTNKEYIKFFKSNRIKRKGLPIYKRASDSTFFKNMTVSVRQFLIDFLVKSRLK